MNIADAKNFFKNTTPCNGAETVCHLLGAEFVKPICNDGKCAALKMAQILAENSEIAKRTEYDFVRLQGAADCESLRGRCAANCLLAAELAAKYKRRTSNGRIRVMLLGDSIRMNYENAVRQKLGEDFEVVAPAENCRFAKHTLFFLQDYFRECGEVDIVHWNNGLWDSIELYESDGSFTEPEEYLKYMKLIYRELEKHCNNIIFASTTSAVEGGCGQYSRHIRKINEIIMPFVREKNLMVSDLYAITAGHEAELLQSDGVHLNEFGIDLCSELIVKNIRKMSLNLK